MWLRITLLLLLSLAFGSFITSCKPSVGSACDKGEARCLDAKHELVCEAGRFIESPCSGPAGCRTSERGTSCDFSANKPGDACSTDDEGAAACTNKAQMLACHGGKFALVPCRGPRGCLNVEGRATCDTSVAEPADVCSDENLKACSADGSQVLICKQHSMQRFYLCRGEKGCVSSAGKLSCDTSVAKLGDACDKKLENQAFACTPDATSMLVCKGGAFVLDQTCKAGLACVINGGATQCAKSAK